MVIYRKGDILEQSDLRYIVHQCNLYHTFGSGIAAQIKKKFPYAYEADKRTKYGDKSRLGTFVVADGKCAHEQKIINLYSQDGLSSTHRVTDYDALKKGFAAIKEMLYIEAVGRPHCLNEQKLGIPYKIGCGLGGGDWGVVEDIIKDTFDRTPLRVVICQL